VRNRRVTSAFAFIHKAVVCAAADATSFSFCSYHGPAPECKPLLVFPGKSTVPAPLRNGNAAAYPATAVEIFGADQRRLT